MFFPKDYELRYDHITDIAGGTIRYALTDFLRGRDMETRSQPRRRPRPRSRQRQCHRSERGCGDGHGAAHRGIDRDEIRIPLLREEIGIEKVARESGHVRIHKTVHTEEKHFSVPVTREEVVIEHVAVGRDAALTRGDGPSSRTRSTCRCTRRRCGSASARSSKRRWSIRTVAHSVDREGSAMLRHEEAEVEDTRKAASGSTATTDDYLDREYLDPDTRH